jgi:hypothetical protein
MFHINKARNVLVRAGLISNCCPDHARRKSMRFVVLIIFVAVLGCETGSGTKPKDPPPPLETTVTVNDMTPPQQGCELLVLHTFNECREGTWHVVTKGTFQCGQMQVIKEVHVVRTHQPCKAGDTPPSVQTFISIGIPDRCTSPVKLFTFFQLECPQNATWNWIAYDYMQCGDGRLYVVRNPSFDRVTTTPCTQPEPTTPLSD